MPQPLLDLSIHPILAQEDVLPLLSHPEIPSLAGCTPKPHLPKSDSNTYVAPLILLGQCQQREVGTRDETA